MFFVLQRKKKEKGPSIKDVCLQSRGREVCPVRTRGRGFFRCRLPYFLVQKKRIFRNLWYIRKDKGMRAREKGVNSSRFCSGLLKGDFENTKQATTQVRINNHIIFPTKNSSAC